MRSETTVRSITYLGLHVLQWIAGFAAAFLTLSAKQAKDPRFESYSVVQWSNNHKGWIFVAMIAAGVAKFSCDTMGPPWAWKAIQDLLDTWQSQIFAGIPNASADEHRITIFKRVSRSHNIKGWLKVIRAREPFRQWPIGWFKPVARSQHVSQRDVSWFPSFDKAQMGEGFIGVVWRKTGTIRMGPLPDLDPPAGMASAADYASYASGARVTESWLRSRPGKTNPRTFCGTRVEKKGNNWGVIVIDSRADPLNVSDDHVKFAAAALGKFIERA